jgi:hypothetical protein
MQPLGFGFGFISWVHVNFLLLDGIRGFLLKNLISCGILGFLLEKLWVMTIVCVVLFLAFNWEEITGIVEFLRQGIWLRNGRKIICHSLG